MTDSTMMNGKNSNTYIFEWIAKRFRHFGYAILLVLLWAGPFCSASTAQSSGKEWSLSVIPSSIRLDPVDNEIIGTSFVKKMEGDVHTGNILEKNWVYDGRKVSLHAARGEYVSFQLVLTRHTDATLRNIQVAMTPFRKGSRELDIDPELFLEWSVQVKTPSTGYPEASLGTGWYPDALIPISEIQQDTANIHGRFVYPLWLPDFNNRVERQRSQVFWVDQYVPFEYEDAEPGTYTATVSVTIGGVTKRIPVELVVWDFAIPNENKLKASIQQGGFLSRKTPGEALEVYQLFKRNRVGLMDPTYEPELQVSGDGQVTIDWSRFDRRLEKYFTGKAFTSEYGYDYGPGYGEPIETFILPFDVYGKHGTPGWPDIGRPEQEREPRNREVYINTIQKVRQHVLSMVNPRQTQLIVYLNGLDESYFPEAWDRMVYYGQMFDEYFPEVQFRVDGGYSEEAMQVIHKAIDHWAAHTINYNMGKVRKYRELGVTDWLYGPMLYESNVNSWVGSSTFIDLPLVNDRAISWATWKYDTYSWLSWGIGAGWNHAWYDPETWKNAYADPDARYMQKKLNGNGQLIYSPDIVPHVDRPCPSIRLKNMRNGVQEYEYLRLLANKYGEEERVNRLVDEMVGQPFGNRAIGVLDIWNYNAEAWDQMRLQLGRLIEEAD